jgi:predicted DNA-binding protein (UPF0251 family)
MDNLKYTQEQKTEIIRLRDSEFCDFSDIAKIMKLSGRKVRSLYQCAKYTQAKNVKINKRKLAKSKTK